MRSTAPFLILLLLFSGICEVPAQTNYSPNQRVALVIGNSEYDTGPLLNPGNDARAMASALRETGFEVLEYINLSSQADMKRAIREFGRKIQNGGVGLFYYAGHGVQVNGKNFLIPTKAQIYAEEEVEYESVDVGFVMSQMEIARNRMNIIILDACRNNPFARSWRSAATGLAFINAPTGTLIAYSTSPGSVASDGTGDNGLYTEELLKQINKKGLKIEDVFKNVRAEVLERSSQQQTPWESSSLVGDFYFIRPATDQQVRADDTPPLSDESPSLSGRVEIRKGTQNNYFFIRDGQDISQQTRGTVINNGDLMVYDPSADSHYLLKDYAGIQDQDMRTPEELFSLSNAFWRTDGENTYWFYHLGNDITSQTNSTAFFEDYLIFQKLTGQYYLMDKERFGQPGVYHPANLIYTANRTLWCANETHYFLYVDGAQIAARTWASWAGNDLLVNDEEGKSIYLLRDYYNKNDRSLRSAEIAFRPGMITVTRNENNVYYPYKNGAPYYMQGGAAFSGNDLLIYDTTFNQVLHFEGFLNSPVQNHIKGTPVISRSGAVWRRQDNTFYLYIRGILQTNNMVSSRYSLNNNDLEVTESASGAVYILEDYANRNDNTLRPAVLQQQY